MTTLDFVTGVGGIAAPDTATAHAALGVCDRHAGTALRNHSLRSYFWAAAHAESVGLAYDPELLFVAAALHDLALAPPFDSHTVAFEEAAGRLADVFAAGAGWSEQRRGRLDEIIVLHMRDDVPAGDDPESHLLQVAVTVDVSGGRLDTFDPAFVAELHRVLPRAGFAATFADLFRDQARRKPAGAAAQLVRNGLLGRIVTHPLDRAPREG